MSQDPALVSRLSAWLAETDLAILELRGPGGMIRLVRCGQEIRSEVDEPQLDSQDQSTVVASPGVGVFLDRHPLRIDPAAAHGTRHSKGDALGFLRIGPVVRAVVAPCDCVVAERFFGNGTTVGYGTPLFAIVPIGSGETT